MTDVGAPALRILVFVGHGTGGSSAKRIRAIGEARGARVDLSGAEAIRALSPLEHDVVVFPGGSAVQQFNSIGPDGWDAVHRFVASGKGVLGLCAGAMLMTSSQLGAPLIDAPFNAKLAKGYGADLRGTVHGQLAADNSSDDNDNDTTVAMVWHNGPFWAPAFALPEQVTAVCSVESFESATAKKSLSAKFKRKSCIVQQGRCVAVGPHPECTAGLEDLTWSLIQRCAPAPQQASPAPAQNGQSLTLTEWVDRL